jgi:hypothetical protein
MCEVAGTVIEEERARKLAIPSKIPVERLFWRDGTGAFIDPNNTLPYPRLPWTQNNFRVGAGPQAGGSDIVEYLRILD